MRESKGSTKPQGATKVKGEIQVVWRSCGVANMSLAHHRPVSYACLVVSAARLGGGRVTLAGEAELERTRRYPIDGELCLSGTKPEETLVEVRNDSDVQIERQT